MQMCHTHEPIPVSANKTPIEADTLRARPPGPPFCSKLKTCHRRTLRRGDGCLFRTGALRYEGCNIEHGGAGEGLHPSQHKMRMGVFFARTGLPIIATTNPKCRKGQREKANVIFARLECEIRRILKYMCCLFVVYLGCCWANFLSGDHSN